MASKFDYPQAQIDADDLITYFGMTAVLRRPGIPDRPCTVAIIEYMPRDNPANLANPTDRKVILSPFIPGTTIEVLPPDNEQDNLVTFVQPAGIVVDEILPLTCPAKPTAPAGVTALYEFTVRR